MWNGQAIGQIFYAPDTIIRSITIWRPASDLNGIPMQLYILGTHISSGDGLPEPDRQVLFRAPAIVVGSGEGEAPIRCEFYFIPPLILPHRGLFAFALQPYQCFARFNVLGTDRGDYRDGEAWLFGRSDCDPFWLGWPRKLPGLDRCFRIEFVKPDAPMPVGPADAQPDTCRIRLTWTASETSVREATVFRRTLGTDWLALGQVMADGTGQLVFDDTLVTPGHRYGYRLGLPSCENDPLFGETWVTAAGGLELKMVGSQPIEGGMRLNWSAVVGPAFTATVYRREIVTDTRIPVDSTWRIMGVIQTDGSGAFFFDDARVLGGARYDYRLGVAQCGREAFLGKANWLQVPCGVGLPVPAAEVSTCEIGLAWSAPDSAPRSATLYRRGPDSAWSSLGLVTSDSIGQSHYVDGDVSPRGQYAYRLGVKTPYCNERFSKETPVSVPGAEVTPLTARATAGDVTLSWAVTGITDPIAAVYRRSWDSDWRVLAQLAADDSGRIEYVDDAVAGTKYLGFAYRLGILQCGREFFFGEVWVSLPPAVPFALGQVQPNPGDADLTVTFSLPDASPARFEVMDVAGRKLFTREVGAWGPGNHRLNLTEGRNLPSGVYLIRLLRDGQVRTARGVILRQRPGRSRPGQ